MKRLLLLFVLGGLLLSTSCKKDECPTCEEPKLYGVGTWTVSDIKDENGAPLTDQTEYSCLATDQLVLNETQDGVSWSYTYYLQYNSSCGSLDLTVTSWAENWEKKKLYVSTTDGQGDYTDSFDYIDENTIKITRVAGVNSTRDNYTIYTFTLTKQ